MFGCGLLHRRKKAIRGWTMSDGSDDDIAEPHSFDTRQSNSKKQFHIKEKEIHDLESEEKYSIPDSGDIFLERYHDQSERIKYNYQNKDAQVESHLERSRKNELRESGNKIVEPIEVTLGKVLGKGKSGTVYKAKYGGKKVAVKVIKCDSDEMNVSTEPLEAAMANQVSHPNLVKVIGVHRAREKEGWDSSSCDEYSPTIEKQQKSVLNCEDKSVFSEMVDDMDDKLNEIWIIMELCNNGSLYDKVREGAFFEDKERKKPRVLLILLTALEIASALAHLHSYGIIHGDLKTQNVLLKKSDIVAKNFVCKVGDFGMSRPLQKLDTHITTYNTGSVSYMPPEALKSGILTPAADVFSFGMLLWELMSGKSPFHGYSAGDIMVSIVEGSRPCIPDFFPKSYVELIKSCWCQSRSNRLKFTQIISKLRFMISGPDGLSSREPPSINSKKFINSRCTEYTWSESSDHIEFRPLTPAITLNTKTSAKSNYSCSKISPCHIKNKTCNCSLDTFDRLNQYGNRNWNKFSMQKYYTMPSGIPRSPVIDSKPTCSCCKKGCEFARNIDSPEPIIKIVRPSSEHSLYTSYHKLRIYESRIPRPPPSPLPDHL